MRPLEGWRPCFFRVLSTPTCIWFQWDGYWVGKIIGDASAIVGNRDGKKRENKKDSVMGRAGGTLNGENVSFRLSLVLFFFFFRVLLNQEAKSLCDNIAIPWTFRPRICVCVVMLFSIRLGRKWKSCPELSLSLSRSQACNQIELLGYFSTVGCLLVQVLLNYSSRPLWVRLGPFCFYFILSSRSLNVFNCFWRTARVGWLARYFIYTLDTRGRRCLH